MDPKRLNRGQKERGPNRWLWLFLGLGLIGAAAGPMPASAGDSDQAKQRLGIQEISLGTMVETISPGILQPLKSRPFPLGGDLEGDDEEEEDDPVFCLNLTWRA